MNKLTQWCDNLIEKHGTEKTNIIAVAMVITGIVMIGTWYVLHR